MTPRTAPATAVFRLHTVDVAVEADPQVLHYLGVFYDRAPAHPTPVRRIRLQHTTHHNHGDSDRDGGGGVGVSDDGAQILVTAGTLADQAITARKAVRALWLRHMLGGTATILHCSAFHRGGHIIIALGASRSGKSSLMLDAVHQGWGFLSDDQLLLWRDQSGLHAAPVPTVVRVRAATAARLGLPDGADREALAPGATAEQGRDEDGVRFWSPTALGSTRLPTLCLSESTLTVLAAAFHHGTDHSRPLPPAPPILTPLDLPTARHELTRAIHWNRLEELTTDGLDPTGAIRLDAAAESAGALITELADRSAAFGYRHAGRFDPTGLDPAEPCHREGR